VTRAGVYPGSGNWPGVNDATTQLGYFPVIVSDYLDATSPSVMSSSGYPMNTYAANLPAGKHYCFGVPIQWTGNSGSTGPPNATYSPANVIAGNYDSNFNTVFTNIAALDSNAIVRLGWEMNGGAMCWGSYYLPSQTTFISMFQHVAALAHAKGLKVCWNPVCINGYDNDVTLWWPGSSYVDMLGIDIYPQQYCPTAPNPSEPTIWNTLLTQGAPFTGNGSGSNYHGLEWYASYAAYLGLPILLPEVGCWPAATSFPAEGGTGDDPYFVQQMGLWVPANNAQIILWTLSSVGILSNGGYGGSVAAPNATAQAIASFQLPVSNVGEILYLGGGKVMYLGGGKVMYV
jgi:Glycosyl hydrolase family 26